MPFIRAGSAVAAFMMIMMTMAPLKMAGVGLGAAAGQASSAASKVGRKGKSVARKGGIGGGSGLGGLGGGVAGAGFMGDNDGQQGQRGVPGQGQAQQGFHSEGGGQVQEQIAPEPDQSIAVHAQSSESATESMTDPAGGQEYTDPDAGADSGQDQSTAGQDGLTEAQAMVMANGNEGVARKIMERDQQMQDLSQETQETGNSYLAAAAGDSVKEVMGTVATGAFGVGLATGNVPLIAGSILGASISGALKGVAGEGVSNTVQNLHKDNNNLRDAAKDTWTNTRIGQHISDFRNRSAYEAQAGDSGGKDTSDYE